MGSVERVQDFVDISGSVRNSRSFRTSVVRRDKHASSRVTLFLVLLAATLLIEAIIFSSPLLRADSPSIASQKAVLEIESPDPRVRLRAYNLLPNSKAALPYLLKGLRDEKALIRETVCLALGKIGGSEAVAGLKQASKDRNSHVRIAAGISLWRAEPKNAKREALLVLGELLTHRDPQVRLSLMLAIASSPDISPELRPVLKLCLEDENKQVRKAVQDLLELSQNS